MKKHPEKDMHIEPIDDETVEQATGGHRHLPGYSYTEGAATTLVYICTSCSSNYSSAELKANNHKCPQCSNSTFKKTAKKESLFF